MIKIEKLTADESAKVFGGDEKTGFSEGGRSGSPTSDTCCCSCACVIKPPLPPPGG